ncbi:MAG TPA: iron ABC transporter permease [Gemmatimonadales bacterium]|nr:iron ABC transporter permease [Gemmatimonadales bacterium]
MSRSPKGWGAVLLALVLAWLVAYPLVLVGLESVHTRDGWTLEFLRRFIAESREWKALWASVWTSVASVLLAGVLGIPLAFLFERFDFPGRRLLGGLVALPVVLPPLVGVIAFLFLYGETGFAARMVQAILGLEDPPWRLEGAWAILLVHAYSMYVYFYLFTRAGLAALDPAAHEAAASLGAGRWTTLRRVTLPLLAPSLRGAALLTFMTALASFSAPYIFGGGFRVMTTQIVFTRLNGDYGMAMVQTMVLSLVALAGLWLTGSSGSGSAGGGGKGVAPARRVIQSRGLRAAATLFGWGLALLLLLPHLTLILLSFVKPGTWTVETLPPAYTTGNYLALANDPERLRPLVNSLWMATLATGAALAIAVYAGFVTVRRRVPGAGVVEGLLGVPWLVPGTVFAIALATAFGVNQPLVGRIVLVGTLWILPLAYLIRNLPIASRAVLAGFRGLDPALEEASASLGAGRWRTLRRVTLPLLRPALAAGATLAFVTALGDFVTSIILYTYDTRPLSLEILSSLRQGDVGVAAAYGVLLMVLAGAVFSLGSERQVLSR